MNYLQFLNKIKEYNGFPATTGTPFTQEQIDEIKKILDKRKEMIDDYFKVCVKSRLKKE